MGERSTYPRRVIITTFPRLHVTLIGMNEGGYRINGGIGFAIREPQLSISCTPADAARVRDTRDSGLSADAINRLIETIERVRTKYGFKNSISTEISGELKTHYGFGTSTAIRLACLEVLFILNDHQYSSETLIQLSGRGGTSGVGIHSYFTGGLILDLGHPNKTGILKPSSSRENRDRPALLMQQASMPNWEIGLCIPRQISRKSEQEERVFFEETCPIEAVQVHETLYHVIFGMYAAIRENDKSTVGDALRTIQTCTWKKAERNQYGEDLAILEEHLYHSGALAVGMSSLGPSLFFLAGDVSDVINKMQVYSAPCQLISTYPANEGRRIEYA